MLLKERHLMEDYLNIEEYKNGILLPFYRGFAKQNIELTLRDINGQHLFITDKLAKNLGYLPKKEVSDEVIDLELIKKLKNLYVPGLLLVIEAMQRTKQQSEYLVLNARTDGAISKVSSIPIFSPNGKFIAFQATHNPLLRENITSELFLRHQKRFNLSNISLVNIFSLDLNEIEQYILTLLLLKYSQENIATLFRCSRSYIAKIISEQLCPKFGVIGASAKLLVEKAISLGYHGLLPKSLLLRERV